MHTQQIRADQCYPGTTIATPTGHQAVTKLYVSKPNRENPNNSLVIIETAKCKIELLACTRVIAGRQPQTLGEMDAADPMVFSNERCR